MSHDPTEWQHYASESDLAALPTVTPLASAFSDLDVPTLAGDVYRASEGQPRFSGAAPSFGKRQASANPMLVLRSGATAYR